jgi:hypothetical protein
MAYLADLWPVGSESAAGRPGRAEGGWRGRRAGAGGWTALIADVIRRRHGDLETVGDVLRRYGRQGQR